MSLLLVVERISTVLETAQLMHRKCYRIDHGIQKETDRDSNTEAADTIFNGTPQDCGAQKLDLCSY